MKKQKIMFISFISLIFILIIILILFFNIPRISYSYDEELDCYYVNTVYGNAKSYEVENYINDKEVKYIKERAFKGKDKIEEVILPSSVTRIEKLAFSDCKSLKSINLNDVEEIERNSFSYCTSLNNLTTKANIGGSCFYGCTSLDNISLTEGLTSIGSLSFSYTTIKELYIPASVNYVYVDAFKYASSLEKISIASRLTNNSYLNTLEIEVTIR